jgi:hypothetical protein
MSFQFQKLIPLRKSDYRTISILPVLAKAFKNVMFEQITSPVIILFHHFGLDFDLVTAQ